MIPQVGQTVNAITQAEPVVRELTLFGKGIFCLMVFIIAMAGGIVFEYPESGLIKAAAGAMVTVAGLVLYSMILTPGVSS